MSESLKGKIILLNLEYKEGDRQVMGYRMLLVKNKNFTRQGIFNWAESEVKDCSGVIIDLKII